MVVGDVVVLAASYGLPSSVVTAGEEMPFGGGAGRGGATAVVEDSDGVLRRPFTDKP